MSGIRTVLFDLDGTLLDTAPDLAHALNRVLEEEGRDALPYTSIRPHVSHGSVALIKAAFDYTEESAEFQRLRQKLLDIYQHNIAVHARLFDGMDALLEFIEQQGMNWGVVTNKPAWLTDPLMRELQLSQRAACIVSGDTLEQSKPHPAPLLHACEQAGSEAAHCVYIGDSARDIEAGKRAGMATITALFGYIGEQDKPHEWGADAEVHHATEIIDWLQSGRTTMRNVAGQHT